MDRVRMWVYYSGAVRIKNDSHLLLPILIAGIKAPRADQIGLAWAGGG